MSEQSPERPAGEGLSDEQMAAQVAGQTSSDLKAERAFRSEADGAADDVEAADSPALQDELRRTESERGSGAEPGPGAA
jgi:hypothetical protein